MKVGKPNPIFNQDLDVGKKKKNSFPYFFHQTKKKDFATLRRLCDNKVSGIQTVLKNM